MKKVKSLKDLQRLMETLGAVKDEDPGFTSWTLDCGPGQKPTSSLIKKKPKKLADYFGYWDDYDKFGGGIDHGEINFDGDKLKSTREIYEGKDCIVSRITDKNGDIRISQIEYPLIYAEDEDQEHKKKMDRIISEF